MPGGLRAEVRWIYVSAGWRPNWVCRCGRLLKVAVPPPRRKTPLSCTFADDRNGPLSQPAPVGHAVLLKTSNKRAECRLRAPFSFPRFPAKSCQTASGSSAAVRAIECTMSAFAACDPKAAGRLPAQKPMGRYRASCWSAMRPNIGRLSVFRFCLKADANFAVHYNALRRHVSRRRSLVFKRSTSHDRLRRLPSSYALRTTRSAARDAGRNGCRHRSADSTYRSKQLLRLLRERVEDFLAVLLP